jgi:hypothetical protein
MSQPYEIAESNLLSASEAWEDYLSLRQALESEASTELLPVSAATRALVRELVKSGVCASESEVVNRAIRSFFVAVSPHSPAREQLLREAGERYAPDKS